MKIILNQPTIYSCEGITIVAGENEIEESPSLTKFLANPLVMLDIDSKVIEIEEKEVKKTKAK